MGYKRQHIATIVIENDLLFFRTASRRLIGNLLHAANYIRSHENWNRLSWRDRRRLRELGVDPPLAVSYINIQLDVPYSQTIGIPTATDLGTNRWGRNHHRYHWFVARVLEINKWESHSIDPEHEGVRRSQ